MAETPENPVPAPNTPLAKLRAAILKQLPEKYRPAAEIIMAVIFVVFVVLAGRQSK